MGLENTTASYQIEITRTGAGAQQAAAEFSQVAAAAKTANTAMAGGATAAATGMATVTSSTKAATSTLKAMQGTITLIGLQSFPQLTMAAITAQQALMGVRAAAAATGATFAAVAAPLAVIAAGIYKIVEAFREYKAMLAGSKAEAATGAALDANVAERAERLKNMVIDAVEAGKIALSEFEADFIDKLLASTPPASEAGQ